MTRLILILMIGIVGFTSFSQSNEKEVPTSTNSTINTNLAVPAITNSSPQQESFKQELEEKENDSISELKSASQEMLNGKPSKGSSTKFKDSDYKSSASPSISSKKISNSVSTESLSKSFTSTKQQSSYQRTQRTPTLEQQAKMDETVLYFEQFAPESFEYHYYKYIAGNYSIELIDHLMKAYQLRPNNVDVQVQLAAYYFIIGDTTNTSLYLSKIKTANKLTNDVTSYAKDVLLSVPQNGTLITHGFDDTYGCAYLQNIEGIRKDVQLISLDFLQSETFKVKLKEKGYILPENQIIDINYLSSFCLQNQSKNIAVSMTTPKEYFVPIEKSIYVVGLNFEYHNEVYNNFSRNDLLWNEVMEKKLVYSSLNEKAKQLSSNYLPMLLLLREVYLQQNLTDKVKEIDDALDKVSVQCKKYDQVQKMKKSY